MTSRDALPLNLYQIWMMSRDDEDDVWVTRTNWVNRCARITSVGALKGPPPFFGNPKVVGDIYDMNGVLQQAAASLPAPGTYQTWRQISTPAWWKARP